MKANPGGHIDPAFAIGRDPLVRVLWDTVTHQSVDMTAERRLGKTVVMKMMQASPRHGWQAVYQDLEDIGTAFELSMSVYQAVDQHLGMGKRSMRRTKELFNYLGGTKIGKYFTLPEGRESHWKEILTKSIEDLCHENAESGTRLLFLWDEMPYMLDRVQKNEGPERAMEVLDVLRALRQTHTGLRMIITGSIGLHHVVTALRNRNHSNCPLNDMARVEVEPLAEADAVKLGLTMITAEALPSPDPIAAAEAMARDTGGFAFYMHHIVRTLTLKRQPATPEAAAQVVQDHLTDPDDPWKMKHYDDRLTTYYEGDAPTAQRILDVLALRSTPASAAEILSTLKGMSSFDDGPRLQLLLKWMERDHYLKRDGDGSHHFRFPLVKRWWLLHRNLSSPTPAQPARA